MKLRDMITRRRLIELCCSECHATAQLDPAHFARLHSPLATLDLIRAGIACPECDAFDVRLRPVRRPAPRRLAAPVPPVDYWRLAPTQSRQPGGRTPDRGSGVGNTRS